MSVTMPAPPGRVSFVEGETGYVLVQHFNNLLETDIANPRESNRNPKPDDLYNLVAIYKTLHSAEIAADHACITLRHLYTEQKDVHSIVYGNATLEKTAIITILVHGHEHVVCELVIKAVGVQHNTLPTTGAGGIMEPPVVKNCSYAASEMMGPHWDVEKDPNWAQTRQEFFQRRDDVLTHDPDYYKDRVLGFVGFKQRRPYIEVVKLQPDELAEEEAKLKEKIATKENVSEGTKTGKSTLHGTQMSGKAKVDMATGGRAGMGPASQNEGKGTEPSPFASTESFDRKQVPSPPPATAASGSISLRGIIKLPPGLQITETGIVKTDDKETGVKRADDKTVVNSGGLASTAGEGGVAVQADEGEDLDQREV